MRYPVKSTFVAFGVALTAISVQAQHSPSGTHNNGTAATPSGLTAIAGEVLLSQSK